MIIVIDLHVCKLKSMLFSIIKLILSESSFLMAYFSILFLEKRNKKDNIELTVN